ncbi:MAG: 2-dehydropantoate 2-reductase N-terminal domain-containing protein [Bacteroidales bacterium]
MTISSCVKANDMVDAAERIRPMLDENSLVVSMQNGIREYELQKIVGAGEGCRMHGPGATMHRQGMCRSLPT